MPQSQERLKAKSDFGEFISLLEQIPLPLEQDSFVNFFDFSTLNNNSVFQKYGYDLGEMPIGIFYKDEKSIGVIDCIIGAWGLVPTLKTYDYFGNEIDSAIFWNKSGIDMGFLAYEYVVFNAGRTISVFDTVKRWDINEAGNNVIEGTMKETYGLTKYQVLSSGQIEEM